MYVHVCMYMYERVYVHVYVYMNVCMYVASEDRSVHAYVYIHMHVPMHIHVQVALDRSVWSLCVYSSTTRGNQYSNILHVPMHIHVQVALDRSGTVLVVASEDHSVKVFDANDGSFLSTLDGHEEAVQAVAFDATGGMLVTSGSDNTFRIWS